MCTCKPDDGQARPKHVADVTRCRIQLCCAKTVLIQSSLLYVYSGMEAVQFKSKYFVLQRAALNWCHKTAVSTMIRGRNLIYSVTNKGKHGKAVPLQAWTGLECSRKLRLPDFVTSAVVGCQPYAPAAFTPRKYSWYLFLLEVESTPEP
jgi:hypothetical protein